MDAVRKRFLLIFLVLIGRAAASDQINGFAPGVTTAYAVIRQSDGDVWYVAGQVFEAWGTGGRTAADYDIALTDKSGGMFVASFDSNVSAGIYTVVTHYQAGGSPADTDPAVWQETGYWDGQVWGSDVVAALPTKEDIRAEVDANSTQLALILADTNELQVDWTDGGRLDNLIDAIKAMTDLIAVVTTTVSEANDANSFTITAGLDVNDAYWMHIIMVEDATDSHRELRFIEEWLSTRVVLLDEPLGFTPDVGDNVWIMGTGYGGFLYEIRSALAASKQPVYYYDTTAGGGRGGAGGTSYYDQTGDDP